jgi:hypothetical protein
MAITLTKSLPSSSFYTGTGTITVTLVGVESIISNTKKTLTKIGIPKTKSRYTASPSDIGDNKVLDLKRIEDTIKISGWIEDDATETAWNKAWKLRAMSTTGGPLSSLVIENLTFPTGTVGSYTIPQAFLESVTFTVSSTDKVITETYYPADAARIKVELDLYIGNER